MKSNSDKKNFCIELMKADSEEKVIKLLSDAGYWDEPNAWRYYGDRASNFNTIGNQMSRSDAALVEKIVNSVDARLINECLERGINPEGSDAPKSMREAVALFFDDGAKSTNAGLIKEWQPTKRTQIAKGITLAATGYKPNQGNPCFIISDKGEGQTPMNLPNTILSLDKDNKIKIPFVQGKYNMGGTGVLEFCGKKNIQLVLSRRNPKLLKNQDYSNDNGWGFTIVRREDPIGGRKSSVYTYLAPENYEQNPHRGEVLSFQSEEMPIFPDQQNPFGRTSQWGTLIKLYEYSTVGFSSTNILLSDGLMRQLDLLLTDLALPVRLYECRKYSGHKGSFETNLTGISVRLEDDKGNNLENDPYSSTMNVLQEKLTAQIYVFKKEKADIYRSNEGVIFSINGQTHGYLTKNFFSRKKVGMSYLKDSILVSIDCSNISKRSREILFMPSRDRLREGDLNLAIKRALEDIIGNHSELKKLREKRRREEIQSMLDDEKPLGDILEDLIKDSPTLTTLFLQGRKLSNPFKTIKVSEEEEKFKGKRFPTYFKFKDSDYGKILIRNANINLNARIVFETDAENNYFSRESHRGSFLLYFLKGIEKIFIEHTLNLSNGIATLNIKLPEEANIGDSLNIFSEATDDTRREPFQNIFVLNILGPLANKSSTPGPRRKPPIKREGDDRELPGGIDLPKIIKVAENPNANQKSWSDMSPPFDENSAMRIIHAESIEEEDSPDHLHKDVYDFYINIDNIYLKTEQKTNNEDPDLISAKFIYALVLLGLSILNNKIHIKNDDDENEDETTEDNIEEFSIAVAPVILPIINELGGLESEDFNS